MALLGDDGRGYELARKLETVGVWRTWLGESNYTIFLRFLDSPSTWEAFMRVEDSKSRAQIHLQLRVRALLFDKASVSLFLRSNPSSSSSLASSSLAVSKLNSTCEFLFFYFFFLVEFLAWNWRYCVRRFAIARGWRVLHAGEFCTRCGSTAGRWCFIQYGVVQGSFSNLILFGNCNFA